MGADMQLLFLLLSVLFTVHSADLNVGYQFLMYATNYCGRGNVRVADIGNGNLVKYYNISEKELFLYRRSRDRLGLKWNSSGKLIPGYSSNPTSKANDCAETSDNSCVGQPDTWYWCHYPEYRCLSKYFTQDEQKYINVTTDHGRNPWVFEGWLDNDSDKDQTMTYSNKETTTNTFSWSFSNTIKIGMKYSLSIKVPTEMDATESLSFDWDSTMSSSTTKTTSKTWSINQPVVVPANTTIKLTSIIEKVKVSGHYSSEMNFPYWGKFWCEEKVKGHWEWFADSFEFLGCGRTDKCTIGGSFTGWNGIDLQTTIKECKLYSRDC